MFDVLCLDFVFCASVLIGASCDVSLCVFFRSFDPFFEFLVLVFLVRCARIRFLMFG